MTQTKITNLRNNLRMMQRVIIAYSGGIDSTLLAYLANLELGVNALALTAVSPSLPAVDLQEAKNIARLFQFNHQLLSTGEVENKDYRENTPLRCYWCKNEVNREMFRFAEANHYLYVLDGSNIDDLHENRPGRRASIEFGVRSPFIEANISKQDIRTIAHALNLPNWDKPSSPCLSTRIPYGTPITVDVLSKIELSEKFLQDVGFRQVRVRHHGDIARLETNPSDFEKVVECRELIVQRLRDFGFIYVTLDLTGYRSGSLNQTIKVNHES